jgi:predicted MFS family arabinose efflux permease
MSPDERRLESPPPTPTASIDAERLVMRAVALLSVAGFASAASLRITDALLPTLAREFAVPLGAVAWAVTCFTVGYATVQPLFGPIGDRYGKYRVVAWACVACSAAALFCALAPTLSALLVARSLAGACTAAIIPLAMAWIGDVVPYERRQAVLARFLTGQILGVAAAQLLGGLSADHFGRRAPFVVLATIFLLSAWLLNSMRARLPASASTVRHVEGRMFGYVIREYGAVFRVPWARIVLLTVFLEGAAVFGAFAFFATHLHGSLGISLTQAGTIGMCYGIGGLAFAFGSPRLIAGFGEAGLALAGAVVLFAAIVCVALAASMPIAALGCLGLGLGFYMLHNTLQINATQMAPERRGAAVSAFAFAYFLGQSAGVAIAGWSVTLVGTRSTIVAGAIAVAAIGIAFASLRRRRPAAA